MTSSSLKWTGCEASPGDQQDQHQTTNATTNNKTNSMDVMWTRAPQRFFVINGWELGARLKCMHAKLPSLTGVPLTSCQHITHIKLLLLFYIYSCSYNQQHNYHYLFYLFYTSIFVFLISCCIFFTDYMFIYSFI